MKTLISFLDEVVEIVPWLIVAWLIFGFATMASAADKELSYEEKVVALTILGEARGEKEIGMYAVGCVIQARADKDGKKLSTICLAEKQFSIWNNGKTIQDLKYLWDSPSAPYAIRLARAMCQGHKLAQAHTGNADHYYSKKIMKRPPSWAYKIDKRTGKFLRDKKGNKIPVKPTKVIGNHVFYNL
tara:strand:- start:26582 stop:27139 length:558 start_codon:yes stop_codon:yes gene_type:complete